MIKSGELKTLIATTVQKNGRLILYGVIGLTALGLEFMVFTMLTHTLAQPIAASNAVAMLVGLLFSFSLNSQYNFRVHDLRLIRFLRYATVTVFGYALSTSIILVAVSLFSVSPAAAKLVSLPAFFLFQYSGHRFFTFRSEPMSSALSKGTIR